MRLYAFSFVLHAFPGVSYVFLCVLYSLLCVLVCQKPSSPARNPRPLPETLVPCQELFQKNAFLENITCNISEDLYFPWFWGPIPKSVAMVTPPNPWNHNISYVKLNRYSRTRCGGLRWSVQNRAFQKCLKYKFSLFAVVARSWMPKWHRSLGFGNSCRFGEPQQPTFPKASWPWSTFTNAES